MHKFNLIPEEFVQEENNGKKTFIALGATFALIIFIYMVVMHIDRELDYVDRCLFEIKISAESQRSLNGMSDIVNDINTDNAARSEIIEKISSEYIDWGKLAGEIFLRIPEKTEITKLHLSRAQGVAVEGITGKKSHISEMLRSMGTIDNIREESLLYLRRAGKPGALSYGFRIQAKVSDTRGLTLDDEKDE